MRQAKKSPILGNLEVLENQRKKKHQQDAEVLERLAKRAGLPPDIAAQLAMNLAPAAKTEWTFAMISPQQNAAVVSWLEANSKRPMKAIAFLGASVRGDAQRHGRNPPQQRRAC